MSIMSNPNLGLGQPPYTWVDYSDFIVTSLESPPPQRAKTQVLVSQLQREVDELTEAVDPWHARSGEGSYGYP